MSHGSFVGRALLALGFLLTIASGSASVAAEDNPTTKQPVNPPAAAEKRGADVKLNDSVVFRVLLAHGQRSAEERAEAAPRALDHALLGDDPDPVRRPLDEAEWVAGDVVATAAGSSCKLGSGSPDCTATVADNHISNEYWGIFRAGPLTIQGLSSNHYSSSVTTHINP